MQTMIKILIAEHDKIDIELIRYELQKSGMHCDFQVVQTELGFINACKDFIPDIILSDYTFPLFDGLKAFEIREAMAPETPFIFVSGTIGEAHSIELIKIGVTDFCLKDKLFTLNQKVIRALKESTARLQRKHIVDKLVESEKRLARAQQIAHMGNWDLNFSTNDLIMSEEVFRIHGLLPNQNRQSLESLLSLIHIDDRQLVLRKINDSRDSLHEFSITYRIVQENGSIRYVYYESKLELDEEGSAIGSYGIAHDVTDTVLLDVRLAEQRLQKQLEITDAMLTSQENERAEIGKELHENLGQILGATKLLIELAIANSNQKDANLEKACESIVNVTDEINKISKALIPPSKKEMGLFDSIRILKDDINLLHPVKIYFTVVNIDEAALGDKLQLAIYRIVQEQLNNILEHAKATQAYVSLSLKDDYLILLISDNGKGSNLSKARTGVGIRNIMSRAEFFQGRTEIKSARGKGYELKVEFPFKQPLGRSKVANSFLKGRFNNLVS